MDWTLLGATTLAGVGLGVMAIKDTPNSPNFTIRLF